MGVTFYPSHLLSRRLLG